MRNNRFLIRKQDKGVHHCPLTTTMLTSCVDLNELEGDFTSFVDFNEHNVCSQIFEKFFDYSFSIL